ncbi:MAG: LPXTG cell wall anchor domain-containing protein [Ilumatobacteraceae bacterium]
MIKRTLLALCTILLSVTAIARPAQAYPPGGTGVATDKSSYTVGSDVVITATGFAACAGHVVTFTITPPGGGPVIVLTAIANSAGIATVTLKAPSVLGAYSVMATSDGCATASTVFNVSKLPQTGANSRSWVITAAALVCTGAGFLFVARRRRQPATAV